MTIEEKRERNRIASAKYKKSAKGKEKLTKYYKDNKVRILEVGKEYRKANVEKEKLRHKKWYAKAIGYKPEGWIRPGSYNITLAERYKRKWLEEKLIVYKLKMTDLDGTIFYKIGLTTNLKGRIQKIPYEVEVVKSLELDKYEAVYFEHNYLKNCKRYEPLIKFKGYSECLVNQNY